MDRPDLDRPVLDRIVIVGAGQGGQQAAASLRQEGFTGAITLIGDEPGLPYQRPPLSKGYMADGVGERLLLKPASFYERSSITYLDKVRVTSIDRASRRVTTTDDRGHDYDHLILATGARNARPPLPGLDAPGVLELRTLAHAAVLRAMLGETRHAIVIGGGFIGLEFAAMARGAGADVTVVEAAPRLMSRAVSPTMSERFLELHRGMGTRFHLGVAAAAVAVQDDGRVRGIELADGSTIAGDMVLVASGVRPDVELAVGAGLDVANGILVDERLLTSDPSISALGDCASFPMPDLGRIRLESVQAAVAHAHHIARRLVKGDRSPYAAIPWFWSDQGSHRLQIAGLGAGADRFQTVVGPKGEPVVLAFRRERLSSVENINEPGLHMAARKLIGAPYEHLAAAGFDLKAAAVGPPPATPALFM